MVDARLRGEEREFLGGLASLIYSNPFEAPGGRPGGKAVRARRPGGHAPAGGLLEAIVPDVERQIERLEARGIRTLGAVAAEDRRLLETGYLFQAHRRFLEPFDALIQAQLARGDAPVEVPFAVDLLRLLHARGFVEDEAVRLVALFYQIRRAYFFIAGSLTGDSLSMQALRAALWNSVFTADIRAYREHLWDRMEDFSTLLLGETGTGKGTAAAAIGRSGLIPFDPRKGRFTTSFTRSFLATNLSQIPETLTESELFGHRKGSFTGAIEHHEGIFSRCSPHGSLFLDEIGDLAPTLQLKLLTVVQERVFSPVGSRAVLRFEGRVIAATNRPLRDLRSRGSMRDDFYYRLCSIVIEVPTLRHRLAERPEEMDQLVAQILGRLIGRPDQALAERVTERLRGAVPPGYAWPGNVRELEQALRRILVAGRYDPEPPPPSAEDWVAGVAEGLLTASELLERYCQHLYGRHGSYEEVARLTALDRRTVRKHVIAAGRRAAARSPAAPGGPFPNQPGEIHFTP